MANFFSKIGLSRREVAPATSPAATPVQQEESKSGNWQEHVEHVSGLRSSLVVPGHASELLIINLPGASMAQMMNWPAN